MPLLQVALIWLCACLYSFAAVAATQPARVHEARQGPVSIIQPLSAGPGPVSVQSTMSSTTSSSHSASGTSSATPQPSSSPGSLDFTVHNMTTCTSGLISWNYTGKEAGLFLSITNVGVNQSTALSRIRTRGSTAQQQVDTNTSASPWTWSSVNLTQGWYEIQGLALATPTITGNASFFIANGTNVSCLTSTSPQGSSTATPGALPISAASKTNVAAIAGGVVGAVVGVALVAIVGIYLWSRRRKRLFGMGGSRRRKWGSLKSTSSSVQPGDGGAKPTGDHFNVYSEAPGGTLEDATVGKVSAPTTPGNSEEDTAITGEEKPISPVPSSGMSPLDALNTPITHHNHRASTYYPIQIPTPIAGEGPPSRSSSLRTSNQSIEQQAQRIRSSMETSIHRRSERLSMPTLPPPTLSRFPQSPTHSQPKEEYPLSPVTPVPAGRSRSTGAVSLTTRRTSRKPVPQYDPSALLEDTNADSVSTFTGGAESSQSHGTGVGTGVFGTATDLVRKASLGDGRPVHYLIPDMPPQQQD